MPLSEIVSPNSSDPKEDVNVALSDRERKICQQFKRIEIRGKRGRIVPVLLTPAMQLALYLLVSHQQERHVPLENMYLFARPYAFTCYHGTESTLCQGLWWKKSWKSYLHKTGTLSQVLNLTNTELDQLADILGHDIEIHRQFYRLHEGTLQLAVISKVHMALDQGTKTLEHINNDPEGNIYLFIHVSAWKKNSHFKVIKCCL